MDMRLKKFLLGLSLLILLFAGVLAWYNHNTQPLLNRMPNSVREKPILLYNFDNRKNNLQKPMGIAVDKQGQVYVTDCGDGKIKIFNNQGQMLDSFGTKGTASGEFSYPYGVVINEKGNLLIADSSNLNIQEFTPEGKFVKYILTKKEGIKPGALTIDELGIVYVSDLQSGKIIVLNQLGQIIGRITGTPSLSYPQGVLVKNDFLWVADSGNFRITVIDKNGALRKVIKGNETPGNSIFTMVRGIAGDNLDRIFVSDTMANQVRVLDKTGKQLFVLDNDFAYPMGIHIDKSGKIYIINRNSGRIQVYGYRDKA